MSLISHIAGKCLEAWRTPHLPYENDPDIVLLEPRVMFSASPLAQDVDAGAVEPVAPVAEDTSAAANDLLVDEGLIGSLDYFGDFFVDENTPFVSELDDPTACDHPPSGDDDAQDPHECPPDDPPLNPDSVNSAPVLADEDVALSWVWEDSEAPSGPVGTLVADIVDPIDAAGDVDRADYVPFYSASSGNDALRSIFLWQYGWDDWTAQAQITLEKHGSLWMHLPYGRISGEVMPGDGRAEAAEGRAPHHGPMPQIAEGMAHYLEQIVRPTDELFFYFGAPHLLYEEGMTYEEYEALAFYEFEDALALADNAKVFIGLDATVAQPKSLGGIWEVVGGVDGYNAQLFQAMTDAGTTVILEPWIYDGETWAYHYSTISTDLFYHNQDLHLGDDPKSSKWVDRSLKTGHHYRLLHNQSDVNSYHGGSWEQGVRDILAAGETPLLATRSAPLHDHAWYEYSSELIEKSILTPVPAGGSPGVAVGSTTATTASVANDNVSDADAGALTGIALVDTDNSQGTWWYSLDAGDNWSLVGDRSTSSALMLAADDSTRLYFQPNANVSGEFNNAIQFRAWDQTDGAANGAIQAANTGGADSALSAEIAAGWLYVTPRNDVPDVVGGSAQSVTAGQELLLSPFQITDTDGGSVRVQLSTAAGSLSLSTAGLSFVTGDGVADQQMVFTSSLANANAALATLRYVSPQAFSGFDGISILVDDQSNGGLGGAQTTSAIRQIEVFAAPIIAPAPPAGVTTPGAPVYDGDTAVIGASQPWRLPSTWPDQTRLATGASSTPVVPSLPEGNLEPPRNTFRFAPSADVNSVEVSERLEPLPEEVEPEAESTEVVESPLADGNSASTTEAVPAPVADATPANQDSRTPGRVGGEEPIDSLEQADGEEPADQQPPADEPSSITDPSQHVGSTIPRHLGAVAAVASAGAAVSLVAVPARRPRS